jgi:hypothetical protein
VNTIRRTAHRPILVAGLGAALAAAPLVIGIADAASPEGGLSVAPVFVEHEAQRGAVGAITVTNDAARPITVTVRVRPWLQSRDGAVRPDAKRTVGGIKLSATGFTLAPGGAQSVQLALASQPKTASVYGAIEVVGVQQGARPRSGVIARYRLLGGLRLNPAGSGRQLRVRVGAVRAAGNTVAVPVRNTGNTAQPLTGSARITGPTGTLRTTIAEQRILPTRTVDLRLRRGKLQAGRYSASITLKQGGRTVAAVTRRFRVR